MFLTLYASLVYEELQQLVAWVTQPGIPYYAAFG